MQNFLKNRKEKQGNRKKRETEKKNSKADSKRWVRVCKPYSLPLVDTQKNRKKRRHRREGVDRYIAYP